MLVDSAHDEEEIARINNKRKESRRHLIYYLNVENRDSGEDVGRVVDITKDGVLLISKTPFESDLEIPVKIELGDELFERMHGNLEVNIKSHWSKKDFNPNYYINGFSFVNHSASDRVLIGKLIDIIGFRD